MFGTQVGLLWEVDESIHVGPLVGFGFLPGKEEGPHEPLWALGLHGRWGQSNRLVVELDYEAVAFRDYTLHGVGIRQEGLYGVGLRVGYEHLWQSGLHLLLAVGPGWEPETLGFTRLGSVSLGVGYQWGGTE